MWSAARSGWQVTEETSSSGTPEAVDEQWGSVEAAPRARHGARDLDFDDFQDLPPWRTLVPAVAEEIYRYTKPSAMLAVQTVLTERYWAELATGLGQRGLPLLHVVLDCDEVEVRRRIQTDEVESTALDWRLAHLAEFEKARPWITRSADVVIDTTRIAPESVAEAIIAAVAEAQPTVN